MLVKSVEIKQCAVVKYCFKIKKTATEAYDLTKQVYGEDSLSRARVFEWYKRFYDGREILE